MQMTNCELVVKLMLGELLGCYVTAAQQEIISLSQLGVIAVVSSRLIRCSSPKEKKGSVACKLSLLFLFKFLLKLFQIILDSLR